MSNDTIDEDVNEFYKAIKLMGLDWNGVKDLYEMAMTNLQKSTEESEETAQKFVDKNIWMYAMPELGFIGLATKTKGEEPVLSDVADMNLIPPDTSFVSVQTSFISKYILH